MKDELGVVAGTAYKAMKRDQGAQDAAVAFAELALVELRNNAKKVENPNEHYRDVARNHGSMLTTFDAPTSIRMLARMRILLCMGSLERFFHELKKELRSLDCECDILDSASFDDILQLIKPRVTSGGRHAVLLVLVSYFQSVRNAFAHPYDHSQFEGEVKKKAEEVKDLLAEYKGEKEDFMRNTFPSSLSGITTEHSLICSRIVKEFGFEEWVFRSRSIMAHPDFATWPQRFSHFAQNPDRLRAARVLDVRTKLGLDGNEASLFVESMGF